jgi:hypothetical protein
MEVKCMPNSNDERKREKKIVDPGNNPYTINSKNNQTDLNSENNKNSMIESKDGIRAIGGA